MLEDNMQTIGSVWDDLFGTYCTYTGCSIKKVTKYWAIKVCTFFLAISMTILKVPPKNRQIGEKLGR